MVPQPHVDACPQHPTLVPDLAFSVGLFARPAVLPRCPADRLEDWSPGARIGEGGGSEVFAGTCPWDGRPVAIKLLRPELSRRRSLRRAFDQEARIPNLLRCPGMPAILHSGETEGGQRWLVMPLIQGVQLGEILAQPHGDTDALRATVALLRQVARTVGSAHRGGVVHCDLKPANVLVEGGLRAWVVDWGLARVAGASVPGFQAGTVTGTVGWMSPEQARGDEDAVGPASDIWAIGCMLWTLLHGEPPHVHPDPIIALRRTVRARPLGEPPPHLDTVYRGLWRILARCLQPRPEDRFADGTVLADVLQRWLVRTEREGHRPVGSLRQPGRTRWMGVTLPSMASAAALAG